MLIFSRQKIARNLAKRMANCAALPALFLLFLSACQTKNAPSADHQSPESLSLLMPRTIQIVKPFTTWSDFDTDATIDGLTVYVQPLNASDDPIQAAGDVYLELYEYRKASGDRKGKRLEHWEFPLRSEADQLARWNRATLMYEFPVVFSRESLSAGPGDKLVLSVTHHSPLGRHQSDEYVLQVPLSRK